MTIQMPCADLRFVHDSTPGVARRRSGKGFAYVDADGNRITDSRTLAAMPRLVNHFVAPEVRSFDRAHRDLARSWLSTGSVAAG